MDSLLKIKNLLKKDHRGLNIREISNILNINRNTAAKLLDILTAKEEVEIRVYGRSKVYYLAKPQDYKKYFELLSRTVEELNGFPPEGDIYAFIAGTLSHITPEDTIILVNSFDQDTKIITLQAIEGFGPRQSDIEAIIQRPLKGLAFSVPNQILPDILTGKCNEIPGGLTDLTFGSLPFETCKKIEALPFFGKVYSAGISWKGRLNGATTFILPKEAELEHPDLITFFIRQVAGFLSRRSAETALRESENKFATVFKSSPVALTLVSAIDGTFGDVNDAFLRHTGYSRDEVIGVTSDTLGIFTNKYERERLLSSLMNKRCVYGIEMKCRTKTGEIRTCLFSSVFTPIGEKPYILSTIEDITERKQVEVALRKSETQLRATLESTADGILAVDNNGNVLQFNQRFQELWRIPQSLLEHNDDKVLLDFVIDQLADPAAFLKRLQSLYNSDAVDMDTLVFKDDRVFERYSFPMIMDGTRIGRVWSFRDITERKKMESEIQSMNRELEQRVIERTSQLNASLEDKSVLLREVHHRVRNNFQTIISLLSLQSQYIEDEKTKQVFKESKNRIHAMALVHEKLHSSTDIATIDLDDYFGHLGDKLLQFNGMKGRDIILNTRILDIHTNINTAIPIGLIVNELVSNSIKHAFPDGRRGEISIAVQRQDHMLTIVYKDNGIGIPADLDWRNAKSMGFRLVIALVGQLDGTIELDRTGGTTFTIVVKEIEVEGRRK